MTYRALGGGYLSSLIDDANLDAEEKRAAKQEDEVRKGSTFQQPAQGFQPPSHHASHYPPNHPSQSSQHSPPSQPGCPQCGGRVSSCPCSDPNHVCTKCSWNQTSHTHL